MGIDDAHLVEGCCARGWLQRWDYGMSDGPERGGFVYFVAECVLLFAKCMQVEIDGSMRKVRGFDL